MWSGNRKMARFCQFGSMSHEKQGHQQNKDKETHARAANERNREQRPETESVPDTSSSSCDKPSAVLPRARRFGSGGGIRTHDLWVMSPASCRCSTPRRASGCVIANLLVGCARSGLASHAVARAVLSGAGVGHDPVRDGTGCCHTALGHAHTRREGKTVDGGSDR